MSFDVFSMDEYTVLEQVGGFLINSSPGFGLILLTLIFWKKERILGVLLIAISTFFIFFFHLFDDFPENILTFFIVSFPLYIIGALFVLAKKEENKI
jgi:hypothetical protein